MRITTKPTLSLLALLVVGLAAGWAYLDYQKWLALGPGGLPYNMRGWLTANWMRLHASDPLETGRYAATIGGSGDCAYLGELPARKGSRPRIGIHPVPHRQLDQLPDEGMRRLIVGLFDGVVRRRSDLVTYRLSFFEKRNQAIALIRTQGIGGDAEATHGEVGHVHPSDGSMHMIVSPSDAKLIIESGWGERHPLAGGAYGLPDTYLLIYPPRTEDEMGLTTKILEAAVSHIAMLPCRVHPSAGTASSS